MFQKKKKCSQGEHKWLMKKKNRLENALSGGKLNNVGEKR